MRAGNDRFGFRLCHYSIMGNHIHLIVEADDTRALSRGVQGLSIHLARRVNGANRQRGRCFSDRYHARVLLTPTDVKRTIIYVLLNHRKHALERATGRPRAWTRSRRARGSKAGTRRSAGWRGCARAGRPS